MISEIYIEVNHYLLLDEIENHKSDYSEITKENGFITSKNGNCINKKLHEDVKY